VFWECPRDTAFPYQNKPTHSLKRNPSLNSILSLKCPYYNPSFHPTFFFFSSSLSLSQKCLFKNTHLGTTCSCKKLHFIVVGNSLQMIIKLPTTTKTTTTPLPPSSLLYYTRPQVSWALGHYITWACENHAGRT